MMEELNKKREEIREWLEWRVELGAPSAEELVQEILYGLNLRGCVLKVDRELPRNPFRNSMWKFNYFTRYNTYQIATQRILRAGYVAVEKLIDGEKR